MGGVVGCAIVAPIVLYRRRSMASGESLPALAQAVFRTVLATTAASGRWPPLVLTADTLILMRLTARKA